MSTEADVRRIALSLPHTTEKSSYGTAGFRVQDKLFARMLEDPEVLVLWQSSLEDKSELIASQPAKFFTTSHYDEHASVLVRLPMVEPDELAELLNDAWESRASKSAVQKR